ncbi:MAG: L-rhamnose/proton symporter RhaT [Phycisphaerae bacterium]
MSAAGTSFIAAVTLHWTGGLASGSFYIPYKGVRKWSWETYWLLGGIFSWLVAPTVFAWLLVPNVWHIVFSAKPSVFWLTYLFGVLWGFGGLTFGLTMRYLGVGLGMAVALSYCAAVGTLVPPIFLDHQGRQLISTGWGLMTLVGVAICLLGIAVAGLAGVAKETELSAEVKKASVAEFSFFKGIVIATFSGIMSACFNFALDRGQPITDAAKQAHLLATGHHSDLWAGLPTLIVILWGGLTTNFVWCVFLHLKNKSAHEYLASTAREDENRLVTAVDGPGYTQPAQAQRPNGDRVPLTRNYILCAMAGTLWYLQFFFYQMGQSKMPEKLAFSGWTLHMASIIIFATIWGIILHEWRGTSRVTHALITLGIIILVFSTIVVGLGSYLQAKAKPKPAPTKAALLIPKQPAGGHLTVDIHNDVYAVSPALGLHSLPALLNPQTYTRPRL